MVRDRVQNRNKNRLKIEPGPPLARGSGPSAPGPKFSAIFWSRSPDHFFGDFLELLKSTFGTYN